MSNALAKLEVYRDHTPAMQEIRLRNIRDWELRKLQSEIVQLRREERHLRTKREERSLTSWEEHRLEELLNEATEVLQSLSELRNSSNRS